VKLQIIIWFQNILSNQYYVWLLQNKKYGYYWWNICNSSPVGDTLPVLYALEAILVLESANGKREVPINEFITGPGQNIIRKDEILKKLEWQ
jgi:xanthine dehydrogenase iron-sulfur cluster and FAD-binding subunit A